MAKKNKAPQIAPDIEGYIASGENVRVARLISMGYLMYTIANAYNEEAFEILQKYGLMHKKVKTRCCNLAVAFDLFDKEIFSLIKEPDAQMRLCNDYDYFKSVCDKFMNAD